MSQYDLLIVGSGPGGYVAAVRASQLGLKVALIEKETELGGVCLNWGCIPTKALLTCSGLLHKLHDPTAFGLTGEVRGDFSAILHRSREVVKRLNKGLAMLMKSHGVAVVTGTGKVLTPGTVEVTHNGQSQTLTGRFVLLAAGARPRELPGVGLDGELVLSSRELLSLCLEGEAHAPETTGEKTRKFPRFSGEAPAESSPPKGQPKSLLVIGGGAIGLEFADFFNALGTSVTVVEVAPRLLPMADEDVSRAIRASFEKRGVKVLAETSVVKVTRDKSGNGQAELVDAQGQHQTLAVQKVLLGVGVVPNLTGLMSGGLSPSLTAKGFIHVGEHYETSLPGVYAIGDITGPPLLAHAASQQARAAVGHMAGKPEVFVAHDTIPACVYTHPEAAWVGETEAALKAQGLEAGKDYRVGRFHFSASGRALAAGETEGFVKVLVDAKYGGLLGGHLYGPMVSELLAPLVMMKTLELTVEDMLACTFAHPTLSEAVYHALADAVGLRTD